MPTPAVIKRGRDRRGLEIVRAREGRATFQIEKGGIERVADPTGHRPKPSLPGPTSIDSIRTNAFALQVAPSRVGFDPDHPFSDLMIESDLAPDHDGVADFRDRAIDERPIAIGKARADMAADIKPAPAIGGRQRRGLDRHQRIRGLRGTVREQCNGRDCSDGAHERSPVPSRSAAAFLCGDQEHGMEDIRSVPRFCASPAFSLEKNQVWRFQHSWFGGWHLFEIFGTCKSPSRL
jgi:hypothetical protein